MCYYHVNKFRKCHNDKYKRFYKINITFKMQNLTILYLKYPFICTVSFLAKMYLLKSWNGLDLWTTKRSQFSVMNDIMNDIVTFCNELWMTKGHSLALWMTLWTTQVTIYCFEWHYEWHSEWQKGHDIVNDSLAHKPDGLLVFNNSKIRWINNSNPSSFT